MPVLNTEVRVTSHRGIYAAYLANEGWQSDGKHTMVMRYTATKTAYIKRNGKKSEMPELEVVSWQQVTT